MKKPPRYRERGHLATRVYVGKSWNYVMPFQEIANPSYTLTEWWRDPSVIAAARDKVERTWDETNKPVYLKFSGRKIYRSGGSFHNVKADNTAWFYVQGKRELRSAPLGQIGYRYSGGFVPTNFGPTQTYSTDMDAFGLLYEPERGDASPYGPEGWDKARPRVDSANLLQYLYELKDLPGMLKKTAEGFKDIWNALGGHPINFGPKKVADHFLNHVFGWQPFLGDLRSMYGAYRDMDNRIAQVKRDNGQWVRRKRTIRKERVNGTSSYVNNPAVWPSLSSFLYKYKNPNNGNQYGYTNFYREEHNRIWFEGAFSYYVPAFDDSLRQPPKSKETDLLGYTGDDWSPIDDWVHKSAQYGTVLGARYSPAFVYKVMPWTWLGDWFHNGGHVINNITASAEDNLAAKYAYIMRQTQTFNVNDSQIWTLSAGDINCFWYQLLETKNRSPASPYGFNLEWPDFTPRQLAVLAALGISKFS